MPPAELLRIEQQIAVSHRILWEAAELADLMGFEGHAIDLRQVVVELERLQTDLLRSRPRRKVA